MIDIHGLGSVDLVDTLGDAKTIVNSARVSLGKRVDKLTEKDKRLLTYLIANEHTSPFRHVSFTFHLRLPIFVLRQWNKHQIGCAWNEASGRYIKFEPKFGSFKWREQSESIKQGSLGEIENQESAESIYKQAVQFAYDSYLRLLELGVCKEQARALLPQSLITECWWTCSFHALMHFLDLRLDSHAQKEIQLFANAIRAEAFVDPDLRQIADIWLEMAKQVRDVKKNLRGK